MSESDWPGGMSVVMRIGVERVSLKAGSAIRWLGPELCKERGERGLSQECKHILSLHS